MSQVDVVKPIAPPPPGPRVSYVQFLAGDWGTPHVEWVDGEVVAMTPITGEHDEVVGFLSGLLRAYVRRKKLGIVRADPFQMRTGPDLPGRAPDLLFVAEAGRSRVHRTFLDGPADLAVEVISPGSIGVDRGEKFAEYERGGVREYWLIDPICRQAEFYRLGDDGVYRLMLVEPDGMVRSEVVPGLWVRVGWLWDRPDELDVFVEWGLVRLP